MNAARQSRNHLVLVVVLVLVIEDPIVEDEDENEDENACRTGVNLQSCSTDYQGGDRVLPRKGGLTIQSWRGFPSEN